MCEWENRGRRAENAAVPALLPGPRNRLWGPPRYPGTKNNQGARKYVGVGEPRAGGRKSSGPGFWAGTAKRVAGSAQIHGHKEQPGGGDNGQGEG